ncbi:MAG: histidine kinase dimerization/phosphoacceptor domain-containing protein, partial [Actinomycetota bacterium]|nr:histidine kinase dimerization/phosphoacceptor domain-containing protein [Actinomycetota bacterium]
AYVLVAATCAPLTVRQRFPFAVGLSTGTLTVLYGVSTLPDPPVRYAALVGLYTVAAWAARRTARLAAGIAVFGVVVAFVIDRSNSDVQDVSVIVLVLATAWLLGDGARNRRERALDLEARAAELERTRERDARAAVAAERQRIAREMHDVIAHHVSMMVVQAEAGPLVVAGQPQRAIEAFDAIGSAGKRALGEMRRLLGVLREDGAEARWLRSPGPTAFPSWWPACARPASTWCWTWKVGFGGFPPRWTCRPTGWSRRR